MFHAVDVCQLYVTLLPLCCGSLPLQAVGLADSRYEGHYKHLSACIYH
jgi:hypothetical protein